MIFKGNINIMIIQNSWNNLFGQSFYLREADKGFDISISD